MVRTSLPEKDTACLHPTVEQAMHKWLKTRTQPAFLLIGPPGVGKTTMVYRVCKDAKYWIQEFNASHTRTGSSFRQTIMPLLIETGVSKWIHPTTPNGRAVLLDEMDGLSQGEKGGLQELLDYLKSKRNFVNDCPLILICNILEGRIMQQLLKYCCVHYVNMPPKDKLIEFFKKDIPDSLYLLGDIRKVSQSLIYHDKTGGYIQGKEETLDRNIHVAIRAAWFTLFEDWGENDELDLETKDANLAGLLFHQNLPLYLESKKNADIKELEVASFEVYEEILDYLRWSDRADFWAFFHQCWNLLPLSYRLKLKYPNLYLQHYKKPSPIPEPAALQYTQVLTKQSALFNAWKEMSRVANENDIPFRCVTQWATHQTGKIYETLGVKLDLVKLEKRDSDKLEKRDSVKLESQNVNSVLLTDLSSPHAEKNESKPASTRKKAVRGKKSNVL